MSKAIQFKNRNNEKVYPCPYYPVGSVYISVNNTNPTTYFGGTWEQIQDRFLLCCGSTYAAGSTGGSTTHQHKYGFQYGGFYRDVALEQNGNSGLLNYSNSSDFSLTGGGSSAGSYTAEINNGSESAMKSTSMSHYRMTANTSATSTLPPYLAVYVWKRVS